MDKTPTQWMVEPLRRYAQFSGRARRAEYWWFVLFGLIVGVVAAILDSALGLRVARSNSGPIAGLVSLALLCPQLAVGVRRLHDIDRTGWWLALPVAFGMAIGATIAAGLFGGLGGGGAALLGILGLAAFAFAVLLLVWACSRGTAGPNRFGPDPLAADPLRPDPHVL